MCYSTGILWLETWIISWIVYSNGHFPDLRKKILSLLSDSYNLVPKAHHTFYSPVFGEVNNQITIFSVSSHQNVLHNSVATTDLNVYRKQNCTITFLKNGYSFVDFTKKIVSRMNSKHKHVLSKIINETNKKTWEDNHAEKPRKSIQCR